MKLRQLPARDLRKKLAGPGLWIRTGPFSFKVQSSIHSVAQGLAELYGQFEVRSEHENAADFHVAINSRINLRRWPRWQADFLVNGVRPFQPLPREQAFLLLESGLSWGMSTQTQQYLIVPAAVVEKHGRAAILIAPMGAGKSTLTAALVLSGWRLLSDEFMVIHRTTGLIQALPRPIILKNDSISIIRDYSSDVYLSRISVDSSKNTVAHMRPPRESVRRQHEPARPGWFIFPQWSPHKTVRLTSRAEDRTWQSFSENLFIGESQQDIPDIVERRMKAVPGWNLIYDQLDDAVGVLTQLAEQTASHVDTTHQEPESLTHRRRAV